MATDMNIPNKIEVRISRVIGSCESSWPPLKPIENNR
jgi:hypothetical protein